MKELGLWRDGVFMKLLPGLTNQQICDGFGISTRGRQIISRMPGINRGGSEGFATVDVPINLVAARATNGVQLSWSSQPGLVYQVESCADLRQPLWSNQSPRIIATNLITSWTDTNTDGVKRFYRVGSP